MRSAVNIRLCPVPAQAAIFRLPCSIPCQELSSTELEPYPRETAAGTDRAPGLDSVIHQLNSNYSVKTNGIRMSVMNSRTVVDLTLSRVAEGIRSDSEGFHGLFPVV